MESNFRSLQIIIGILITAIISSILTYIVVTEQNKESTQSVLSEVDEDVMKQNSEAIIVETEQASKLEKESVLGTPTERDTNEVQQQTDTTAAEIQQPSAPDVKTSKLTISTPSDGAALCIGENQHLLWSAPEDWISTKILLQDYLTEGNYHIDTVKASDSIYVWEVGATKDIASKTVIVEPGLYRIIITRTNHSYEKYSVSSEPFDIIEC